MISSCPFKNMTVPEIINEIQQEIEKFKVEKSVALLRNINSGLDEGARILRHALVYAPASDKKRVEAIKSRLQEISGLKQFVKGLEKGD